MSHARRSGWWGQKHHMLTKQGSARLYLSLYTPRRVEQRTQLPRLLLQITSLASSISGDGRGRVRAADVSLSQGLAAWAERTTDRRAPPAREAQPSSPCNHRPRADSTNGVTSRANFAILILRYTRGSAKIHTFKAILLH